MKLIEKLLTAEMPEQEFAEGIAELKKIKEDRMKECFANNLDGWDCPFCEKFVYKDKMWQSICLALIDLSNKHMKYART